MARTKTLLELVKGLRAELRHELAPNLGENTEDRFRLLLNSVQEELWLSYDWDDRKIYRYKAVRAGQAFYDWPSDLDASSAYQLEYKWNNIYIPLEQGINRTLYIFRDTDRNQRSDPIRAFDFHLDEVNNKEQIEVWPMPSTNGFIYSSSEDPPAAETEVPSRRPDGQGFLRFRGVKLFTEMVNDSDECILDSRLLILFAAAHEATAQGSSDAEGLAIRANRHLQNLTSKLKKTDAFMMGTDMHLRKPESRRRKSTNDIRFKFAFPVSG